MRVCERASHLLITFFSVFLVFANSSWFFVFVFLSFARLYGNGLEMANGLKGLPGVRLFVNYFHFVCVCVCVCVCLTFPF